MTTNLKLTATPTTVLEAAADRVDGNIEPLPSKLRGGARTAVIDGLLAKGLVSHDSDNFLLTDAGYAAVGRKRPAPKDVGNNDTPDDLQNLEVTHTIGTHFAIRAGTKQATLIAMLQRPNGATVNQVMESTGWLAHTVRGAISGAIKKKLGLNVVTEKPPNGERAYRIV